MHPIHDLWQHRLGEHGVKKIGAKDGDGDWSKLEGPGEPWRTKLESPKARERCPTQQKENELKRRVAEAVAVA